MLQALTIAAHAIAATLGIAPAEAGPLSTLPWPSGAKGDLACLARLRHQPVDVQHVHVRIPGGGWAEQVQAAGSWVAAVVRAGPPVTLASFALVPDANKGQLAQCAAGAFDPYWRRIGASLGAAAGTARTVVVEPGWEANIGSGSHAWGVDDASQLPAYKACFAHASAALRSAFPAVKIAWTNSKIYRKNFTADQMNPGDQNFDYYGLMYYDNYTPLNSQATWDKYVDSRNGTGGSPSGIGSWLAYAQAHGKKLGVSEWGLWDTARVTTAQADDPVYIRNMAGFFAANALSIAYEAYQNNSLSTTDGHELCPNTLWPKARAEYAKDFSAAPATAATRRLP